MKKFSRKGFSLVELVVVMGVLALLIGMGASLFRNAGRGAGQDAVRALVLAGLSHAQTLAITSGEPVALVMTPYMEGRVEQRGRSFTVFEVSQDEVAGNFVTGRQLRRWTVLPRRFIFSKGGTVSDSGQNGYREPSVVGVLVREGNTLEKRRVEMPAIIFGGAGRVIWPVGEAELELHLMEGQVVDGEAVGRGVEDDDWQKREVIIVGRQTGRARYLRTQ